MIYRASHKEEDFNDDLKLFIVVATLYLILFRIRIKSNQTSRVVLRPFYSFKMTLLDQNCTLGLRFAMIQRIA